jgi:hypothetical protein
MKERLLEFLAYLSIGQNKFEENAGLSIGYINKLKGDMKLNTINKIIDTHPELNKEWLIAGEGEMLKPKQQIGDVSNSAVVGANVNGNGNKITHNDIAGMIELQKGYQDLLRKKDDHISELLLIVNKLTGNGN